MKDSHRHDLALDEHGRPLAMAPADVRKMVNKMVDQGTILAIVVELHGELAVNVLGPPSMDLVETLEHAVRQLRTAVEHAS
jgi:hypothetical protein